MLGISTNINKVSMIELIINKNKEEEAIAIIENGKLVELYNNDEESISRRLEGNIYAGKVSDIVVGMQGAFVDFGTERNGLIHLKDALPQIDENKNKKSFETDIRKVLKKGETILVQVKKDRNDKKGARVSTHISIPSRYIVLMPNTDIITISQKIEDNKEKDRLIQITKNTLPKNCGAVIRTSAEGKEDKDIIDDIKYVLNKWQEILTKYNMLKSKAPAMIYKSDDIAEKAIIDMADRNLEKIFTNDEQEYNKIKSLISKIDTLKNIKIELSDINRLEQYNINKQIESLSNRKIWLNCGGFITIDKTEALTAIDVNTGKFTGGSDLETTIFKVNKEATLEIAKQLRLRDIGGIIIIDYIDMHKEENKQKIEELLKETLKQDRAKTQVEGFTKLNLMEMTRKHICSHVNE